MARVLDSLGALLLSFLAVGEQSKEVMGAFLTYYLRLPWSLKLSWGLLWVSVMTLAFGYFLSLAVWSWFGLACLVLGYAWALLDLSGRKAMREVAAPFYVGLVTSPMMALFPGLLLLVLAGVVWVVRSYPDDFSLGQALRLLHFVGILVAFALVSGIGSIALRSQDTKEGDE